jgi:hypothetical protein
LRHYTSLPTRLVRVRQNTTSARLIANVCLGVTLPTETQYLSLSHSWGKNEFLLTTRDNIELFKLALPVETLTQTFQDALLATTNLGFEYICIKNLCIIQDDLDDWKREASMMGDMYKDARFNISASAFANGNEGLVLPQGQTDLTPVLVGTYWKESDSPRLQRSHDVPYYNLKPPLKDDVGRGPLLVKPGHYKSGYLYVSDWRSYPNIGQR